MSNNLFQISVVPLQHFYGTKNSCEFILLVNLSPKYCINHVRWALTCNFSKFINVDGEQTEVNTPPHCVCAYVCLWICVCMCRICMNGRLFTNTYFYSFFLSEQYCTCDLLTYDILQAHNAGRKHKVRSCDFHIPLALIFIITAISLYKLSILTWSDVFHDIVVIIFFFPFFVYVKFRISNLVLSFSIVVFPLIPTVPTN